MTDALQEYLQMEMALKQLPEHMRLTNLKEEKARFEGIFKAIKGVRKEFCKNYLKKVVDEVKLLDEGNLVAPHVEYDTQFGKLVIEYEGGKKTKLVDPYELRLKCRCAACIDEIDGR